MTRTTILCLIATLAASMFACPNYESNINKELTDSLQTDSLQTDSAKYFRLTENDYSKVADELGIDIATMKAVVEIEAGHSHQGFIEPGIPIINFDLVIFKRFLRRAGINYAKYSSSTAFRAPNVRKYGSYGKAQWARLDAARKINTEIANKATFWGMFQIGGFNWKNCGCASLDEFIEKMSTSEAEQLELFAQFCIRMNLVKYLRKKDWNGFAYHYNGRGYKKRGYHIRLQKAHKKHTKK